MDDPSGAVGAGASSVFDDDADREEYEREAEPEPSAVDAVARGDISDLRGAVSSVRAHQAAMRAENRQMFSRIMDELTKPQQAATSHHAASSLHPAYAACSNPAPSLPPSRRKLLADPHRTRHRPPSRGLRAPSPWLLLFRGRQYRSSVVAAASNLHFPQRLWHIRTRHHTRWGTMVP